MQPLSEYLENVAKEFGPGFDRAAFTRHWAEVQCGGLFAGTTTRGENRGVGIIDYYVLSRRELGVQDARVLQGGFFGYPHEGYGGPTGFHSERIETLDVWVHAWSSSAVCN